MKQDGHQKVQVVIIAVDQSLLLQTSLERGGFWQNITGSVEQRDYSSIGLDQTLFNAAKREVFEETGLPPADLVKMLPLIYTFHDRWGRQVKEHSLLFYYTQKAPVITLSSEHQAFKWANLFSLDCNHYAYESNYKNYLEACEIIKDRQWD